jgi:AraC family transcriptional activator of pobA
MDLHRFEDNKNLFFDPKPHTTDFFELLIIQEGTGYIELNGLRQSIQPNSVFFISPFQKKACSISHENLVGFHLVFQNNFLADFFNDKLFAYRLQYFYNSNFPQFVCLENPDYKTLQFAFDETIKELQNYQKDSPHILRSLLYFALAKLNRLYASTYGISSDTNADSMIYRFKELMELNIRSKHTVSEYCELLNLGRHELNSMVKAHTGFTSKDLINNRLLQEIKTELRYTNKTISEIAFELNFSEPNNLTRFFKNRIGSSPSQFKTNYHNDSY